MSTAELIELKPGQHAWLEITCEGGTWLASDGRSSYSLRGGNDLLAALRVAHGRSKPSSDAMLVQVEKIVGGWLLHFGDDMRRVVHEDDRTSDRVLDDIRRSHTKGVSLLERLEAAVYSGDENDRFQIPLTEHEVSRGQLRAAAQGARWLMRLGQAISLSPKPPRESDG